MIIVPEVMVTPDFPTIRFREPRDQVDLSRELPKILHSQGWGCGTYFHVQFLSHDKTQLLASALYVVSREVESLHTSEANPYQPMTKTIFGRTADIVGNWWVPDGETVIVPRVPNTGGQDEGMREMQSSAQPGGTAPVSELLPEVSRKAYEEKQAETQPAPARSPQESQREVLRQRLQTKAEADSATMRGVQKESANAPSGLRQADTGGVVVPEASLGSTQGADRLDLESVLADKRPYEAGTEVKRVLATTITWNPGKKMHQVKLGDKIIYESADKELARRAAAGEIPVMDAA